MGKNDTCENIPNFEGKNIRKKGKQKGFLEKKNIAKRVGKRVSEQMCARLQRARGSNKIFRKAAILIDLF